MTWLLLALLGAATAQPEGPPPEAVVAGEDLDAWRELQTRRLTGDEAVDAWAGFLVRWPASPLAEVAWARLREAGALETVVAEHPEIEPWLPGIEASWRTHQHALERPPVHTAVADLAPDGTPRPTAPPPWRPGVSATTGVTLAGPFLGLGGRVERGPVVGLVRLGLADRFFARFAARAGSASVVGLGPRARPLGVYGEAAVDTRGAVQLAGVGSLWLDPRLALEAVTGLDVYQGRTGPFLAAELVFRP